MSRIFAAGFVVGYLAAHGYADISDEQAQPGYTAMHREAIRAMGKPMAEAYRWKSPEDRSYQRQQRVTRKTATQLSTRRTK